MSDAAALRLFWAVDIPVSPMLRTFIDELAALGRPVRAMHGDQLHVTLKFLGDTLPQTVPDLVEAARMALESHTAFPLTVKGTGTFPSLNRPTVIWAALEPERPLRELASALDSALELLGIEPEKRPFQPHVTLARIKTKPPRELRPLVERYDDTEFGSSTITEVLLMQSKLRPEGPLYTVVETIPLQPADR